MALVYSGLKTGRLLAMGGQVNLNDIIKAVSQTQGYLSAPPVVVYDYDVADTDWIPHLLDKKIVAFTSASEATITSTIFADPLEGDWYRVGNVNPGIDLSNTITINDGVSNVITMIPGEIVRIYWNTTVGWIKIPGN